MGLYKLCEHKGRNRDRCEHPWWGSFRGVRVSLTKWANREIRSKAEAGAVLDEMRMAMRAGTFDARGLAAPKVGPMTFRELAEIYREQHVIPKRLAMGKNYTWSVKPFVDRFGDRAWSTSARPTCRTSSLTCESRAPSIVAASACCPPAR